MQAKGCRFARESARHTIYMAVDGRMVEVPRHREIKPGTARNIVRQAGVPWSEFEREIS